MKRFRVLILAIGLLLVVAAPVSAIGPYNGFGMNYNWSAGTNVPRGYQQFTCDGSERFKAVLFRDINFGGMHTMVCSGQSDMCQTPMEPYDVLGSPCDPIITSWFNDHTSSIKVLHIDAGYCLDLWQDANYPSNKPNISLTQGNWADMRGNGGWNDSVSSMKAVAVDRNGDCQ